MIVLIAIIPTAIVFGWFALAERGAAESRLQDDQARRADLRAQSISQMLVDVRSELEALSALSLPVDGRSPRSHVDLSRVSRFEPSFRFLGLADPSGHVVAASTEATGLDVSHRSWFKRAAATRRPSSDGYEIGALSAKPSLVMAVPVLDSRLRLKGVIFAEVPIQVIGDHLGEIVPPKGTTLIVLDHEGIVLARQPEQHAHPPGSREATRLADRTIATGNGTLNAPGSDGIVRRWDYRRVIGDPTSPLYVLVGYDETVVFASDERAFAIGVAALLLAAVVAVVIASIAATRWVLSPISALNEATGRGPHDQRAHRSLSAAREFGELGTRFDEMAANLEAESLIADRLQEAMLALPEGLTGVEFAHAYHSATEAAKVGGDFYDLFKMPNETLGITIGDVAGKGLDAAVLTSLIRNTIRAHAPEKGAAPARILEVANDVIFNATRPESFVTVFFGALEIGSGRFVWASAGHTTGVLVKGSAGLVALSPTGTLLGAFEHAKFAQVESHLGVGELIFLYTDGLTEAKRDHALFGEDRVFELLRHLNQECPERVVQVVADEVLRYSRHQLRDDMALLALTRLSSKAEAAKSKRVMV